MSNTTTTEMTADTMHSSDDTQASAWSFSSFADPTAAVEEPRVRDDHRRATAPTALGNWAVASVLVGALSAFAALGVVISSYYINPDPPAPVAVAPGALTAPATPSAPAIAPPAPNVAVPAAVITPPAPSAATSDSGPAVPRRAPAPQPVASPPPPATGPAPVVPVSPPAAAPAPVVIVNVPLPQLPPPPKLPLPTKLPLTPPSAPAPAPTLTPQPPVVDPSPPVQELPPAPAPEPPAPPVEPPAPPPAENLSPAVPDLLSTGPFG